MREWHGFNCYGPFVAEMEMGFGVDGFADDPDFVWEVDPETGEDVDAGDGLADDAGGGEVELGAGVGVGMDEGDVVIGLGDEVGCAGLMDVLGIVVAGGGEVELGAGVGVDVGMDDGDVVTGLGDEVD